MKEEKVWLCWEGEPKTAADGSVSLSRLLDKSNVYPPGAVFEVEEGRAEKLVRENKHLREATGAEIAEREKRDEDAQKPQVMAPENQKLVDQLRHKEALLKEAHGKIAELEGRPAAKPAVARPAARGK